MPMSSTKWWPSRPSPLARTDSPTPPCFENASSMWSRNFTSVATSLGPPSRSSESSILVSLVSRLNVARRAADSATLGLHQHAAAIERGANEPVDQRIVGNADRRAFLRQEAGRRQAGESVRLQDVRPALARDDDVGARVVAQPDQPVRRERQHLQAMGEIFV